MSRMWAMVAVVAVMSFATAVRADVIQIQPSDPDLQDLSHANYYVWKVIPSLPAGQHITGASLFIDNLNESENDPADILYMQLLSSDNVTTVTGGMTSIGTNLWRGNDSSTTNALGAYGITLTTYSDYDHHNSVDFTYNFTPAQVETLASYAAAGSFGLGFDADCYYLNDGVKLTLCTAPNTVPAPGALLLAGLGTAVVGWIRRTRQHLAK
jgi:hypothetical protein